MTLVHAETCLHDGAGLHDGDCTVNVRWVGNVDLEERSPVCVEAIEVHSLDQHDSTHELGLGGQGVAFQGSCNCVVEGMLEFRDMAVD